MGKVFFVSGSVLQHTLEEGILYGNELADITNGVIQGTGFQLQQHTTVKNVLISLNTIDKICREVESTVLPQEFLRVIDEVSMSFRLYFFKLK